MSRNTCYGPYLFPCSVFLKPFVNPSKKKEIKMKQTKSSATKCKKVSLQLQYKALQYKKGKQ